MSTQFTNRQWRLPNNENKDKQSNYSMDFDGGVGSALINLGNDNTLNITGSLSVSAWFKTLNNTSSIMIATKDSGTNRAWQLYMISTGWIRFAINGVAAYASSSGVYDDGNWHHVVALYEPSNYVKLYIDGVADGEDTSSVPASINDLPSQDVVIGAYSVYDNGTRWNGQIDGVAIFDYALSSSQITTLYGSSSTGIGNPMSLSPKPVAYYPLGDQDAFNGANYLVPNSSLKDYVFDFDANSGGDFIDLGSSEVLFNSTSGFSFSTWCKLENYSVVSFPAFCRLKTDQATGFIIGLSDLSGYEGVFIGSNSNFLTARTQGDISSDFIGVWKHVVVTFDGINRTTLSSYKIYVDGQPVTLTNAGTFGTTLNDNRLGYGNSTGTPFNGLLSNSQIFNTALPATGSNSVETLYNNGSPLTSMSGFTSLQGWWKLDASATYDGSNWSIPDSSSNSNTGTSSGMTQSALQQSDLSFKTSYSPFALNFDGANDSITIPSFMSNLPSNDIYTISTWVKTDSDTNCLWGSSSTANLLYAYVTNGTTLGIGRGSVTRVDISNLLTVGEWANVVAVFDSSTNLKIYINNVFIQDVTVGSLGTVTDDFKISGGLNGYHLACSQSNVSVWNTALTSAQVSEIYNEGVPSNLNNHSAYSNLVSWWQLGSNSSFNTNWTVLDEKGSNDGTSVNMTEADMVDGVGSYANGLSSGMGGDEVIGDAPYSTANSLSVNMDVLDRVEDTPS